MTQRDYRDIIGGALLFALGVSCAIYAYHEYEVGTLARMGPGFFPISLGVIIAIIGVLIILPALARRGARGAAIEWRTGCLVIGSIGAFAFVVRSAGLIVATILCVIIGSLADRDTTWRLRMILAVAVTVFTVLIFKIGLNMSIPLWWGE